ncbi:MAG: helix-turn-helix transcriptional regulator [Bacteroidia bacterium]|nr:helix-turn-helix transcriptional regulator [Bacteroidia bacterium]
MAIIINLDVMLAKRKMKLNELSGLVGISVSNLSIIKTGKAKAIKLSTLDAICNALNCQPGNILEFRRAKDIAKKT